MDVYNGYDNYLFISYAHKDSALVLPIAEELQNRGFLIWYDSGIKAGTEWPAYIEERIKSCCRVLVFLSENSTNSRNCRNEINYSLMLEKEILIAYLEETDLKSGMDLQLNSLQYIHRNRHGTAESFIDALAESELLQPCKKGGYHTQKQYQKSPDLSRAEAERNYNTGMSFYERGDRLTAFLWFEKAAKASYAPAQLMLGDYYSYGYGGMEKNPLEAAIYYSLAAESGDKDALCSLALCYFHGNGVACDHAKALSIISGLAEAGHPKAQMLMGVGCEEGIIEGKEPSDALLWYERAADSGNADAMFFLAVCYDDGNYVEESTEKAIEWYTRAAELGNSDAQYTLGWYYSMGRGVPQDQEAAIKWYSKAAEKEDHAAQRKLGNIYDGNYTSNDISVQKDRESAIKWYAKAAAGGDDDAQYRLGCIFEETGTESPYFDMAIHLYSSAGKNGNIPARRRLREIAESGYASAEYEYGLFLEAASPSNAELAKSYFERAAKKGHIAAKKRLE